VRENLAQAGEAQKAEDQFMLAELQWTRFQRYRRAVEEYRKVIDRFPDSEVAPKAAYAIAYIQVKILGDSAAAAEAVRLLLDRYPDSQQARYVWALLPGFASAAPDTSERGGTPTAGEEWPTPDDRRAPRIPVGVPAGADTADASSPSDTTDHEG
jgi:tetratricopeptide (TPR) repeat protein